MTSVQKRGWTIIQRDMSRRPERSTLMEDEVVLYPYGIAVRSLCFIVFRKPLEVVSTNIVLEKNSEDEEENDNHTRAKKVHFFPPHPDVF